MIIANVNDTDMDRSDETGPTSEEARIQKICDDLYHARYAEIDPFDAEDSEVDVENSCTRYYDLRCRCVVVHTDGRIIKGA